MQKANDKEEILLKRPWTDEETNTTLFSLKDFEAYLKRNKFFEYKLHKIAQRLRDMGAQSRLMKIKGRPVRVGDTRLRCSRRRYQNAIPLAVVREHPSDERP